MAAYDATISTGNWESRGAYNAANDAAIGSNNFNKTMIKILKYGMKLLEEQ